MREGAHSLIMVRIAALAAKEAGAEVRELNLAETILPLLAPGNPAVADNPNVKLIKEQAAWADAFIIATPEYHGGPTGAIKNWFDHLYAEFAGKVAALIAATGGDQGDQSVGQMEIHSRMCHMWTLPYVAHAGKRHFADGNLTDDRTRDRLIRMGHDVVRYGALLHGQFQQDIEGGAGPEQGLAGFHAKS